MQIEVTQPAGNEGLIFVVDGLIDPDLCDELLIRLDSVWSYSHDGKTLGGVDYGTKTTEDLHFSERAFIEAEMQWDSRWGELENHFATALGSAVAMYKQQYRHLDDWLSVADTGFQVQKYQKMFGYYRPHMDSFPGSMVHNRVLGSVTYLNTVDFGGETNFPLHNVKVQPKAGRIALFPAVWTHPHESCVPITGDKWIISSFIINADMVPPQNFEHPENHDHPHGEGDHTHEPPPFVYTP
jgi:hypothetical protein